MIKFYCEHGFILVGDNIVWFLVQHHCREKKDTIYSQCLHYTDVRFNDEQGSLWTIIVS